MELASRVIVGMFLAVGLFTFAGIADAHQSGCHRWHSCPSDSGSYTCGDLGYSCQYSTYSTYSQGSYYTYYQSGYYSQSSYYVSSNSDCPSYGFAYLGSCYELPDNAMQAIFSGFDCKYGYEEVGYGLSAKCLPEVDHGYYVSTTLYCDYGYEKYRGSCVKDSDDYSVANLSGLSSVASLAYSNPFFGKEFKYVYLYNKSDNKVEKKKIASSCLNTGDDVADKPYFKDGKSCYYCEPGSITDEDKDSCYLMTNVCQSVYGVNSIPKEDGVCTCSTGYKMESNRCVLTQITTIGGTASSNKQNQLQLLLQQLADLQKQVQ